MEPLTVRQMRNRFQKLVDQGYGGAIVLSSSLNPTTPRVQDVVYDYIGPSQYDQHTYRRTDKEGTTVIV